MARKEPDPPHELDPLKGGLKHNPFAALRSKAEAAGVPMVPSKREVEQDHARTPEPPGAPAPVHERIGVRIERTGRGGKTVTIAEGPGFAEIASAGRVLETLAREIARGMGTGARVEGARIIVQGDQRERLVAWLSARGFTGAVAGN